NLVLRALHLEAVRRQLELAEQDDALVRTENVVEERLVEPDRAQAARLVAQEHLEDLEARPPRRPDAAAQHLSGHRRGDAAAARRDGLEVAAILVPRGKAVEQVFDRREP